MLAAHKKANWVSWNPVQRLKDPSNVTLNVFRGTKVSLVLLDMDLKGILVVKIPLLEILTVLTQVTP